MPNLIPAVKQLEGLPHFLSAQFTKEEIELAAKISNDITEGVNCNETRKQLRRSLYFWSAYATDLMQLLNKTESGLTDALTANLKSLHELHASKAILTNQDEYKSKTKD